MPEQFVVGVTMRSPSSNRSCPRSSSRSVPFKSSFLILNSGRACGRDGRASRSGPAGGPGRHTGWRPHDVEGSATLVAWSRWGRSRPGSSRQVGGHDAYVTQPGRVLTGAPSPQVSGAVALHHVDHLATTKVHQAGGVDRRVLLIGGEERRLVDAQDRTFPTRSGSSTRGVPWSSTAFMTVHQQTRVRGRRRRRAWPARRRDGWLRRRLAA